MYTLDQVLKPEFKRSWHEAVALVQEVADALGPITTVPAPEDLIVEEDGTLVLGFASETAGDPVTGLGRLLVRLLDGVDTPPALHTLAVDNAKTPPAQATVAGFTRALAFFERPDRRGDLRAVAGRLASRNAAVDAEQEVHPVDADEEVQRIRERIASAEPEPAVPTVRARPRMTSRQAAIAAVIVIALIGAFAGVRLVRVSALTPVQLAGAGVDSPDVAASPPAAVGTAEPDADTRAPVAAASSPVAEAPTPATLPAPASKNRVADRPLPVPLKHAPQRSAARADPQPSVAKAPEVRTANRWPPPTKAPSRIAEEHAATNGSLTSRPVPSVAPVRPPVSALGSESAVGTWTNSTRSTKGTRPATAAKAESVQSLGDEPSRVYSAAEPDVAPARLLRSQLPQEPAAGADTGYFELTVDEAGDVEFVRLLSPTHRYQDRILVAAAKAWKFRPAMLHGRPVKYRLRIPIILREPR